MYIMTQGNPITGYRFTWKPEQPQKWLDPEDYKAQKRKEQARKKASKPNLPSWYENIPTEKTSKEELEEALRLTRELTGR